MAQIKKEIVRPVDTDLTPLYPASMASNKFFKLLQGSVRYYAIEV